jgi:hypothetical protein
MSIRRSIGTRLARDKHDIVPAMTERSKAARKAWKTRKTVGTIETEVMAHLPLRVDLTKRNSGNDLRFTVKSGGELLGTLQMGRGSVRWFAPMAKKATGQWTWKQFASLLNGG